jgi:hypothetical protein
VNIAHHEGDGFLNLVFIRAGWSAKAKDAELAPAGGKLRGCDGSNCIFGHTLIIAAGRGAERDA